MPTLCDDEDAERGRCVTINVYVMVKVEDDTEGMNDDSGVLNPQSGFEAVCSTEAFKMSALWTYASGERS